MASYSIEPHATRVHIYTFAEGLFAKFAHDLALNAVPSGGGVSTNEGATVALSFDVNNITVLGVRRREFVDAEVLRFEEKDEIERRIRTEFFPAKEKNHFIDVEGELKNGRALFTFTTPEGRKTHLAADVKAGIGEETALITGLCKLSLSSLGIGPIKGPLGAFKVKDEVHIDFHAVFRAEV